jgi:hypothetical protein
MLIQILGDWDYKPKSCGMTDTVVTFRRLSGNDELNLGRGDAATLPVRRFIATVAGIRNPPQLQFPDGSVREMTAEDIPDIPELADLYFELVVAYSEKTTSGLEALKKKNRVSSGNKRAGK